MNAREKLNTATVMGAVVFGALAGGITGSWTIFLLVALILLGLGCCDGSIRGASKRGGASGHRHGQRRR